MKKFFGILRSFASNDTNRWLFNGKVKQITGNLSLLDYGARMYNSEWNIWRSQDPLAEKYYPWSQYNYTLNNPMIFADPDGMQPRKTVKEIKVSVAVWTSTGPQLGANVEVLGLNAGIGAQARSFEGKTEYGVTYRSDL